LLILIVDDHELIRNGLAQSIVALGITLLVEPPPTMRGARSPLLFTKPDLVMVVSSHRAVVRESGDHTAH
jgi:DNA-binding NarL/FixJ family response regulator